MDEELLRIIDLFDDDEVTTADKIDRPAAASYREMFDDFNARNPFAGGGMLVQPGFGGTRQGYKDKKKGSYFTDRITDKERLKFLDEAAKKYGYKDYKSVPITKAKKRGGTRYGDREKVIQEANRRQRGVLTLSEARKGKIPKNIKTGALYAPEVKQKMKETLKKKTLATPRGERLQWIADNGKRYDNPKDFIKAYEKHFKHKLGSKSDALFNKKLLEKDGRIPLTTIDNLQNTGAATDVFFVKPGFSEEEIFKASIIQNNPRVQNKFKNLFSEIHNNVSLYSELGPEGIVERLNSGKLLEDFDFINSTSSGGKQTYGGVHRGITRSSLKVIGIPDEHIVSYQSVRKPLLALSEIIENLNNPSFAKQYKISPSTVKKISGQLENFLRGEAGLRKDIANINLQLGDVKFNQIFGGVNFEHTLSKAFGKDYKYLPRNYLLKGQFTTKAFNMFKRDVFDLPLIKLMKDYEQGKVSGDQVQKFIDDFNAKTNNYADFSFDVNKGKLAYADNAVKYDLSRYADPNVARQELIKNIDLTMSPQFQKGFADVTAARDQLKLFKSKEAQNARNLLARIGCPGKGSGGRVGFFEGQNAQACADRGLIKLKTTDPKNLSPGDRRNFQNLTKTLQAGRVIKNFLGPVALAYEGLFALPFAAYDYQAGRPGADILKNVATLGFMDQKLRDAELKKIDPTYGQAQKLDEVGARFDELERLSQFGTRGQRIRNKTKFKKIIPELQQAYEPFMVDGVVDSNLYLKNLADSLAAEEELQKQYDIRAQERKSEFDLGDPFMAAGGGIAGLSGGIDEGPQTVSMNPDSQGLRSLKNRVRNL